MAQNPATYSDRLVVFSPEAEKDQYDVYDSTAEQWGDQQAEAYSLFLLETAQKLANNPTTAPLVPNFDGVRVYTARWKNARQGHRIFFKEIQQGIYVIRILHTRMNWEHYIP